MYQFSRNDCLGATCMLGAEQDVAGAMAPWQQQGVTLTTCTSVECAWIAPPSMPLKPFAGRPPKGVFPSAVEALHLVPFMGSLAQPAPQQRGARLKAQPQPTMEVSTLHQWQRCLSTSLSLPAQTLAPPQPQA